MKLEAVLETLQKLLPKESYLNLDEKEIFDGYVTAILDYTDGKNICGSIKINKRKKDRKYSLEVSSIRYYSREKKCTLTGTQILNWIKKINELKIFKSISLVDASSITFPKSKVSVPLTRFRKFVFGKGWYESYGFFPSGYGEQKLYQTSFLNFQRNSINNLGMLLYCIFKDLLRVELKDGEYKVTRLYHNKFKIPNSYEKDVIKKVNKVLTENFGCEKVGGIVISDLLDFIYEYGNFMSLLYIITKIGVCLPSESGIVYDAFKKNTPDNTCILKALTPGNMRKIIDKTLKFEDSAKDTLRYIEVLDCVLHLCEILGILYIPRHLFMTKRLKTHKKNTERCVKSFKKYQKKTNEI